MATWVALLRGVGGGIRPLPMRDLVKELEGIGLKDVRTYIQSGNLVFNSPRAPTRLAGEIERCIEKKFGFHSNTFVLSVDELRHAAANNPFPQADATPKLLHLFFLEQSPETPQLDAMNELKTKSEQFALKNKVFYFYTPDGFGISKLATRVDRLLGVETTARNWRTVGKLLEMTRE
jgi:uncharacterized protein (DUF1697 family)